jgi:polyisoprenoid-binding protein YceI
MPDACPNPVRRCRWTAALVLGVAAAGPLAAQSPVPDAVVRSGELSFDGHATTGDFRGVTTTVSGQMTGGASLAEVRGWVEAPAASLRTGNGRRDRDMNRSLETDRYPTIRFDLTHVVPDGAAGDSTRVTLQGTMHVHGISRPLQLVGVVARQGPATRLRSRFQLDLRDYRIEGLSKFLGILKMSPIIGVHVDVTFAPAS